MAVVAESWLIRVYDNQQLVCTKEGPGPWELGRQDPSRQELLYNVSQLESGDSRLVIALNEEVGVSRQHARVQPIAIGRVRIENLSAKVGFTASNNRLGQSRVLKPGQDWEVDLPVALGFGTKVVSFQALGDSEAEALLQSLENPAPRPFEEGVSLSQPSGRTIGISDSLKGEIAIPWLKAVMGVLQSAATDFDFFEKAARAVVDLAGMDSGRVLARHGEDWNVVASATAGGSEGSIDPPSRLILKRVCDQKRTFWFDPFHAAERAGDSGASLAGVQSVVAAPILDSEGEVIAVLYGESRVTTLVRTGWRFSRVDAMLVELLAGGVAAGLARTEQQHTALALQTQFEQFFTPDLARQLVDHPELLQGKDVKITALFCDIRRFSRISRDLGPARTLEWVSDVLSTLSDCVLEHQGVLVDYIGDALMAMWGAPQAREDDPKQACRAALAMIASLPDLNRRWAETLGEPMGLTIGINTGEARVGNTGSRRKFKYGPLGDTVNVASRVQGAAKYFKATILLTRATGDELDSEFHTRRLGRVRVHNIAEPIELYELLPGNYPHWEEIQAAYETALSQFEAGDFSGAARSLGRLVHDIRDDGPTFALLARALDCMMEEPETFDPCFRLPGK
jgi:adenylate cyclase